MNTAAENLTSSKTALIVAGGTGGHIFPGLAVAKALLDAGWQVHWVGAVGQNKPSMESELVPQHNLPISLINFAGVRGKGKLSLLTLPWRLIKAFLQSKAIIKKVTPAVMVGFGGYVTFPVGLAAKVSKVPLIIHEQNTIIGSANKWLSSFASKIFTAFPNVVVNGQWVGNPIRSEFFQQQQPQQRYASRTGNLKLLVLGGSLGAKALNDIVPQAIASLPVSQRPQVVHQSGQQHLMQLQQSYQQFGISAVTVAFIADVAKEMAQADLIICRAGASTVAEIAVIGVAAIFVPYPYAIDDHQTKNAQFLVNHQAAILLEQEQLSVPKLSKLLQDLTRDKLTQMAQQAKQQAKQDAVQQIVAACEKLRKSD